MNLFSIAWKSLRQRWLASSLTSLSVSLGVALMVAILIVNGVVDQMFSQTGSGYSIIVGARGSRTQLIMSTIYRMDRPIENLPWRYFEEWKEHKWVERAVPMNLGDTTQEGGFPIVGTTPEYFLIPPIPDQPFRMKVEGDDKFNSTWDAVIGSQVARKNGWEIGSEFQMVHSGGEGHIHDEKFTVKGILAPTGTPNDRTVFVHIDGFFALDGHDKPVEEAIERELKFYPSESRADIEKRYAADLADIRAHAEEEASGGGHDHHHHHAVSDLQKEVTAVLVTLKNDDYGIRAQSLEAEINEGIQAQAARPTDVMGRLMINLVGNVKDAFLVLTGLIILVSGIGIFVSIYNSMADRKKEIAIMRALGARRQTVMLIILSESLLLCMLGAVIGLLLGHGLVFFGSPIIEQRAGLLIDPYSYNPWEFIVVPIMIAMSALIGILPGLTAYSTDVAEGLQS
ncbi:MAG: ABC transporter permease [Planctomycetaceae bacterium]|nr:ABC transporter permease [Planctomycetaceae bacterium]MCB9950187.1 ABC transporter permease [Planctomycetaceae bacterium]